MEKITEAERAQIAEMTPQQLVDHHEHKGRIQTMHIETTRTRVRGLYEAAHSLHEQSVAIVAEADGLATSIGDPTLADAVAVLAE